MSVENFHNAYATGLRAVLARSCASAALAVGVGAVSVTPALAASGGATLAIETPAAQAHQADISHWKPRYLVRLPGHAQPSSKELAPAVGKTATSAFPAASVPACSISTAS